MKIIFNIFVLFFFNFIELLSNLRQITGKKLKFLRLLFV